MIEADSRIPGFLAVSGGCQHGSGRVPEANDGGDEPENDSNRNDPATPAAAVVQPDSQREKNHQGGGNADGKLRDPDDQTPFFHVRRLLIDPIVQHEKNSFK